MNDEILRRIHHTNQSAHAQVLEYFEQLKVSDNGWELCAQVLLSGQYLEDEQIRFFCYQVIENFVAKKYSSHQDSATKQKIRNFLVNIMQMVAGGASAEKGYVKNKLAQLVSLVFVVDYPTVWPTFYTDMMQFAKLGGQEATDLYLRILKAIDVEVVDREVLHTVEEQTRNTNIKDYMREQCIVQLVDSWYDIMSTYEGTHPQLVCSCLEVVGLYVAWIDINLIANDRMVPILIRYINTPLLRESACEAVTEILHKGMEPEAKVKLIESFTSVLESAGVMYPSEDEEGDFVLKLSKLVNCMGENLVLAWDKSVKAARVP
ncbi:XPOT [Bugula neritina]|uniref:Exportin-T n=1 Tax=Bugula neritina TaxID=10212 RepID=A0A7J7J6E6_BUGNE|nr:XPOT [Bugula neritina]